MSGCYPNNICNCGCHPALENCSTCCIKHKVVSPMELRSCKHGLVDHCNEGDEQDTKNNLTKMQELEIRVKKLLDYRSEALDQVRLTHNWIRELEVKFIHLEEWVNMNVKPISDWMLDKQEMH